MNNLPGKLIVFYGINNLGKSTQARLLVEKLQEQGYKSEYIKYPIYDLEPSGRMLNDYLRNGNPLNLNAKEVQAIYALNRTQYQDELKKKLTEGVNIVAEDYTGTGIAWGLGAGVGENYLKDINSHLIKEDMAILFDGERFKQSIEEGHKHENNNDLINKVRWSHLKLKEENGWIKIDANLKIEEIRGIIWDRVSSFLNRTSEEIKEEKNTTIEKEEVLETEVKPQAKVNHSGFRTFGDIIKNQALYKNSLQENKIEKIETKPTEKIEAVQKINLIYQEEPVYKIQPVVKTAEIKTETKADVKIETKNKIGNEIKVERVRESAKLPTKAHSSDAGFDLYADAYYSIMPYGQALVGSGIKMAIPDGYAGLIWDKSGLANLGITTMGGVIDSAYRGEIKVVVKNLSEDIFNIVPGQKIAQIIIQEAPLFNIVEDKIHEESERGNKGFGSSGNF